MSVEIAVVGVTFTNPDDTNRQDWRRECKPGQPVVLIPEQENKYDPNAIAVFVDGAQIRYLPKAFAAKHREYTCEIQKW